MKIQHTFKQPHVRRWTPLLVFVVLFLIIGLLLGTNQPKPYPAYVTDSPAPNGIKAFYTYLHNKSQVGLWKKPVNSLPSQTNQLMVMVEPDQPFEHSETLNWKKWIGKGNTLLLFVDDSEGYFNINGDLHPDFKPNPNGETIKGLNVLKGSYHGVIQTDARLKLKAGDHALLKDKEGVLALSRDYEKGQLMVVLAPNWLRNDQILKQDHLKMILSLINPLNPQTIWFNERIHGSGNVPRLLSVYPKWFLFGLGDLLVVALLWLWYKGKRFGPVDLPREWAVRFGDERLHASAAWYRRGHFYKEAIRSQVEYLRIRIQEKWGISVQSDYRALLQASERRLSKARLKVWEDHWRGIETILSSEEVNHKAFLSWTNRIDEMRKEVDQS